jgi:hypothetical protein
MFKNKKVLIAVLAVLILAIVGRVIVRYVDTPREILVEPTTQKEPESVSAENLIIGIAALYKVSPTVLSDVAMCESSVRHEGIYGDGGKAYGIMQFHQATFDWFKVKAGRPDFDRSIMSDQIELAAWAIKNGLGHHWTCYRNPS